MTHFKFSPAAQPVGVRPVAARRWVVGGVASVAAIATLLTALPAMAHHPFGGQAPQSMFEGLLSGIGHPVLGFDHFAFVIAIGLLAAVLRRVGNFLA